MCCIKVRPFRGFPKSEHTVYRPYLNPAPVTCTSTGTCYEPTLGTEQTDLFLSQSQYCLWYLEKVLKYINRNAYILVAVKGYSYCYSALQAIKLIILNMLRIAAVNTVGDFLTWLGKIVITGACALGAFFMYARPAAFPNPTRAYGFPAFRPRTRPRSCPAKGMVLPDTDCGAPTHDTLVHGSKD